MKSFEEITKEEFKAYETVRESGLVNMLDRRVCDMAGFDKDTHVAIIHYYSNLMDKWPDVRKTE